MYDNLDFKGTLNSQLTIPKGYAGSYDAQRPSSLTGNEEICGELLVFEYMSHRRRMKITEFDTLSRVEEFILGDAGVLNIWTTAVVVIRHSRLLPYRVSFVGLDGIRVTFEGQQHHRLHMKRHERLKYNERKIEWGWAWSNTY